MHVTKLSQQLHQILNVATEDSGSQQTPALSRSEYGASVLLTSPFPSSKKFLFFYTHLLRSICVLATRNQAGFMLFCCLVLVIVLHILTLNLPNLRYNC